MSARGKPTSEIKILNQWLKTIKVSNRQDAQRKAINDYLNLRSSILKTCAIYRRLSQGFGPSDVDQMTERNLLDELEDACTDRLLELIPTDRRENIRTRAASTAEKRIRNLGHLEFLAHAELRLRTLAYLCLKTSSFGWSKRHRIPEWETLISRAKEELQRAVDEWKQIKRRSGH